MVQQAGNGPTAVKSKIDYLLSGLVKVNREQKCRSATANILNVMISHKVDEQYIEKFWNL